VTHSSSSSFSHKNLIISRTLTKEGGGKEEKGRMRKLEESKVNPHHHHG
jgi:hypothetical protein